MRNQHHSYFKSENLNKPVLGNFPEVSFLSLTRIVISMVLGAVIIALTLFYLEPPIGILLGIIICGLLVGVLIEKPRIAFITGAISGFLGFLMAYILGGGGSLGFSLYKELLGPIGPLVPLAYYTISCSIAATLVTIVLRVGTTIQRRS